MWFFNEKKETGPRLRSYPEHLPVMDVQQMEDLLQAMHRNVENITRLKQSGFTEPHLNDALTEAIRLRAMAYEAFFGRPLADVNTMPSWWLKTVKRQSF